MTDTYVPTEQAKVRLDYAQTEMRRPDPWLEFEYFDGVAWRGCNYSRRPGATHHDYRRKPRTVTVELPVIIDVGNPWVNSVQVFFRDSEAAMDAVAALREIAEESK